MLIFDLQAVGEKLHAVRRRLGMTQAEVAEASGLSDRTYADKETELWERLNRCNSKDKETALQLLAVYLKSLD